MYSVTACKQEYLVKCRDLIIQETSLEAHIRVVINRFVRTSRVDKGKSLGRPSVSEEVVDDLRRLEQNPQTFLTRLFQQSGVPVATKLNNGFKALTKVCYRTFLKLNRK